MHANSNNNRNGLVKVTVLWEHMDQSNRWIPYSALVCGHLERAVQKSLNTNLFLGDIEDHLSKYSIRLVRNAFSAIQVNSETGTRRAVRRLFCSVDHILASGISWFWFDKTAAVFKRYNFYVQEKIERAFQKGESSIDIQAFSFALPYIVHFRPLMMQRNKLTGKTRTVRRATGKPYPTTRVSESLVTDSSADRVDERSTPPPIVEPTPTTRSVDAAAISSLVDANDVGIVAKPKPRTRARANPNATKVVQVAYGDSEPGRSTSNISTPNSSWESEDDTPPPIPPRIARRTKKKPILVPPSAPPDVSDSTANTETFFERYTVPCDQSALTDDCIICMELLSSQSPYSFGDQVTTAALSKCRHAFHRSCLQALLSSTTSGLYVQCPLCKLIHGVKLGDQPFGTMTYTELPHKIPGYEDSGTICVVYSFEPGIQEPGHPEPGKPYQARGFPRYCYLPNNDLGKKVLRLLKVAWERRLIFTIGQSVTTGQENTVTWNEIHHKTELGSNYSGHGYPDPNYLTNVQYELAAQGVTEDDLS